MAQGPVTVERITGMAVVSVSGDYPLETMAQALADAVSSLGTADGVRVMVLAAPDGLRAASWQPIAVAAPDGTSTPATVLAALRQPTIAFAGGACLDAGLELALACDVRIAAPDATFGLRHVQHGMLPTDGGAQRLTRLVGRGHALRLLLTGDVIGAEEALRIGLVQAIGGEDEAVALARRIAAAAPVAAAYVKEAVMHGAELTLVQGLRLEADLSFLLQSTADRAEGLRSFRERKPPEYEGR